MGTSSLENAKPLIHEDRVLYLSPKLVPEKGLEPLRGLTSWDFKSQAYTTFATPAKNIIPKRFAIDKQVALCHLPRSPTGYKAPAPHSISVYTPQRTQASNSGFSNAGRDKPLDFSDWGVA